MSAFLTTGRLSFVSFSHIKHQYSCHVLNPNSLPDLFYIMAESIFFFWSVIEQETTEAILQDRLYCHLFRQQLADINRTCVRSKNSSPPFFVEMNLKARALQHAHCMEQGRGLKLSKKVPVGKINSISAFQHQRAQFEAPLTKLDTLCRLRIRMLLLVRFQIKIHYY